MADHLGRDARLARRFADVHACGFQRLSSSALVTTLTLDSAIAAPATHRAQQAERGERNADRRCRRRPRTGSGGSCASSRREMSSACATSAESPRISVMPAVCIATSVPRRGHRDADVGGGQRRRVVDAVADHRDLRPARERRAQLADDGRLVARQHLGAHVVDAELRRRPPSRCRGCRRSPARVRTPSACRRAIAAAAPGLSVSPKASRPSSRGGASLPPHPASHDTLRPCCLQRCRAPPQSAERRRRVRSIQRRAAEQQVRAARLRLARRARPPRCTSVAAAMATPCGAARSTARASGCSLPRCSARPPSEQRVAIAVAARSASASTGRPSVSVPVLSKATTRTSRSASSASTSWIRMPWRAATPVPTMIAVGVARPSAHGQAMTSTATACSTRRRDRRRRRAPSRAASTSAMPTTTGTNTALTRSTRRWIGAFFACADSTRRTMRASVVSAPTAVVRTHAAAPSPLTAPPVTRSPGALGHRQALAGEQRLVDMAAAFEHHAVDRDALAGPHDDLVADAHLGDRHVALGAVAPHARASGRSACSARIASVVCRLARASSHLPSSTSVMTTAADSKYSGGIASAEVQQREDAQAVGGARAERDQQVHVAAAGAQRGPAGAVEARAEPELHRRRRAATAASRAASSAGRTGRRASAARAAPTAARRARHATPSPKPRWRVRPRAPWSPPCSCAA